MVERRSALRFDFALPVELRLAPEATEPVPISVKTRDISTQGFYFNIPRKLTVGTHFEFSIALPTEVTGAIQAHVSGKARAVRVEEAGEGQRICVGVGAIIESYRFGRIGSAG